MAQPRSRQKRGLPEVLDPQAVRERFLALQDDITSLESQLANAPASQDTVFDDTVIGRKLYQLRYDFDRHGHRAHDISGTYSYEGHFKIVYSTLTSVTVGNGWVSLRAETMSATGGALAISAVDGYHWVKIQVWYNTASSAWKYQIVDSTGDYPSRITTITDGGIDYECYQQTIGLLQVAGGEVQESSITQIIHDECVNLIDWTDNSAIASGYLFKVSKNSANEVAISAGVVISGTDVLQVSNTTESIPSTNGTYYLSIEISYNDTSGAFESTYSVGSSYPSQTLAKFVKLIASIVVSSNEVYLISQTHKGGEIINPRIAE